MDNRFHMELAIPEEKEQVQFLGRAAYCSEISGKMLRHYDAGIEFIEMDECGKKKLKEFINLLQSFFNQPSENGRQPCPAKGFPLPGVISGYLSNRAFGSFLYVINLLKNKPMR